MKEGTMPEEHTTSTVAKKKGRVPQKVKNIAVLVERFRDQQVEAGKTYKDGSPFVAVRIGSVASVVTSRNGGDTDAAYGLIKDAIERDVVLGSIAAKSGRPYGWLRCVKDGGPPATTDKRTERAASLAEKVASDLNF
jgi:hypothetical protein